MSYRLRCALPTALLLAACAATPPLAEVGSTAHGAGWHAVPLPGKQATHYSWAHKDGRTALAAVSEDSASMYRQPLPRAPGDFGDVSFSWWVQDLVAGGNVADAAREDAPARVMFAFDGDITSLSMRTRALFELAEALTGEKPPYATLMYVWDAQAPVGSVIVNPRSDRIRKIVVDSGPGELRRWRLHRRNLVADFRLAFGEEPGALGSVAVMTDSDNTRSRAASWYGPVELH
ncbi:MAG: DUF3047 domain-containing protein [Rubrivivax sp.]|nr:DUF3047 domain-containing protein [Rubrivivax sp.]